MSDNIPERIKVQLPGVKEFELDGMPEPQLKLAVCKHLGLEEKFTNLIYKKSGNEVIVDYIWGRQQIHIGLEGQFELRMGRVVVVGIGALGNDLVRNLVLMGIGHITLIDHDKVEVSNLNRTLFTQDDIGKNKAEALADTMNNHYPYSKLKAIPKKVETCSDSVFKHASVIIGGLDSMLVRIWLADYAIKNHIPFIDGGLKGLAARVQVWMPGEPCLACDIPAENYAEIMDLHNSCENIEDAKIASFPTVSALTASIQANEAMKIILGKNPMKGVLLVDMLAGRFTTLPLARNPECIVCKGK